MIGYSHLGGTSTSRRTTEDRLFALVGMVIGVRAMMRVEGGDSWGGGGGGFDALTLVSVVGIAEC